MCIILAILLSILIIYFILICPNDDASIINNDIKIDSCFNYTLIAYNGENFDKLCDVLDAAYEKSDNIKKDIFFFDLSSCNVNYRISDSVYQQLDTNLVFITKINIYTYSLYTIRINHINRSLVFTLIFKRRIFR